MVYLVDTSDETIAKLKEFGLEVRGQSKAGHVVIGRIEVANREGGGAVVILVLPADDEARTAMLRREPSGAEYRRERA